MPLKSMVPGKNIRKMYHEHGGESKWPRARIVAAGFSAARQNRKKRGLSTTSLSKRKRTDWSKAFRRRRS